MRGVYGNPKEAELKAKKLQGKDKYHNIFIGDVGKWLPWDPQPHEIAEQEYGQEQLNTLMRKYKENEDNREKYFEERAKGGKKVFGGASAESAGGAGASAEPEPYMAMEMAGGYGDSYSFLGVDTSAQGDGGISMKHNFTYLNGSESVSTREASNFQSSSSSSQKRSRKEELLDQQMEQYMKSRDSGIPQRIARQ